MARWSIPTRELAGFAIAALSCAPGTSLGQCTSDALASARVYTLQQCLPPCACVTAPETGPLTGTLTVCFDHTGGTTQFYNVTADLTGTPTIGPSAHLIGTGVFTFGPSMQQLTLDLSSNGASALHYDSGFVPIGSLGLPSIALTVQTAALGCSRTTLAISAAPPCLADFNADGHVTVQDIFDFLAAWFAGSPRADFNGTHGVTVQDIFDFLAAWFAGCP
jgi:hypothetical protein